MNNYRKLVPVGMVAVMGLSWYMMIDDAVKAENIYNNYLTEARSYAEEGITKYAVENYLLALAEKSSPELYREIAEYYKEEKDRNTYIAWCEDFFDLYPTDVNAYECLLDAYLSDEDYEACYDILEVAEKRKISSEPIEQIRNEIKYIYSIDFSSYEEVGIYSYNLCAVKSKDRWGYVDRMGNKWISCKFGSAGAFSSENLAAVVNSEGEAYFIDSDGEKVKIPQEGYRSFGLMAGNRSVAECEDGTYCYVDMDLQKVFGSYEFATTMNSGRAAVKTDGLWSLIDENGTEISAEKYVDVKYDEKTICYRNDRIFAAKENGQYVLLDGTGKQVGNLVFEDARVFMGDMPAAVKIAGNWCFINADGERISEKTYEEAHSFSNGLAAVKINGNWGFVDENEMVVIEAQFLDASDFNNYGSVFVKTGEKWQLLKLYRLNR